METKHTPGPWCVRWSLEPYIGTEQGFPVITGCYDGSLYVENDVDLTLAAAAPELLEALEKILGHDLESDGATYEWETLVEACKEARAVIAKATTGQKTS